MTFDEALAQGGLLLPAWDDNDVSSRTLGLYRVGPAGAASLTSVSVDPDDREAMTDRLLDQGLRIGRTYGTAPFVWVMDHLGCTIWSDRGVVVDGSRAQLTIGGVSTPLGNASRVFTFIDPKDRGHRGVRIDLGPDRELTVVEEFDRTPHFDPTYGRDNEMLDTMWTFTVGTYLASWLSLSCFEQDRGLANEEDLAVQRAAHALACDLERAPSPGPFPELSRSAGDFPSAGGFTLRIAADPSVPDRRFLAVRVAMPGGASPSGRRIRQGSAARIAAFLRDVATPREILRTMRTLPEPLKREGDA